MPSLFPEIVEHGYEHVSHFHDAATGLRSIIAVHDTRRGPALGGCRFYDYASDDAALADVLRLSRAMTYKASLADLPLGGGKSVILGDPRAAKTPALLRAFGAAVDRLGGRYVTTVDSGTTSDDMVYVAEKTRHVVGLPAARGGSDDPSPNTAVGVFEGIKACLEFHFGSDDLRGRRIALLGVGNVGYRLARMLHAAGATLALADVRADKVREAAAEFGAEAFSTDAIFDAPCDVFAPCALGGMVSTATLPRIQAPIIAGAANNQLADDATSAEIQRRGILYAPDFAINAGGLIHITLDLKTFDAAQVDEKTRRIRGTILEILQRSKSTKRPTETIAIELAREKLG